MIDVFLVDDHEVVRRGLRELLDGDPQIRVVGEASNYVHAAARIPALRPDVAVIDVRLPDGNGIDLCGEMRSKVPGMRCLILTSYEDDHAMLSAIMAGASGYVMKDIKGLDLTRAIRDIGEGKSLLDNRATSALMRKLRDDEDNKSRPIKQLTEQEKVLLGLLGEGLTNRQIAGRMFLAEKTVKNYVSRLLGKLGVERRTQAAILATKLQTDLTRR